MSPATIGFGLVLTAIAFAMATRRSTTAALACISFHLHLLGDLAGSRGPDGFQWPIPYLLPFSDCCQWVVSWRWPLNGWPNIAITCALLALTIRLAWSRGYSPLEIFSSRADRAIVSMLHRRFPRNA